MTAQRSLFDLQMAPAHNGTPTSVAAAVAAIPRVGTDKRRIIDLMAQASGALCWSDNTLTMPASWGWTQDELSFWLELPRSTVCARMNELEKDNWVRKTEDTRPSRYGRECAVYVMASGAPDDHRPAVSHGSVTHEVADLRGGRA